MPSQTLTLEIPSGLFTRLKQRAENAHRSIEDETLELLASTVPNDGLPMELRQILASLEMPDNDAVRRAARSRLAAELSAELETLHLKRQREGLTEAESQRCAELVEAYERSMLIRAQAAALLKQRSVDGPDLVVQP